MTALYTLTGDYARLMEAAEAGEDVSDALERITDAIEHKGATLAKVIANLEADAAAYGAEEARFGARRGSAEAQVKRVREYVRAHMQAAGIRKIKGDAFSITLSPGQDKVVIRDKSKVPPELMRQPKTPETEADKVAILALHQATGEIPPGCDIEPTYTLRIR